jgi:Holliday junction DNA helicase RuvB
LPLALQSLWRRAENGGNEGIMKLLKQLLDSVASKAFSVRRCSFENITGNDGIKLIINKAILSERPVHVLLTGRPGCAKTMFLMEMMRRLKNSYFIVGSNTTKAGLVNQLFENEPKYLLIDELDKMNANDQVSLLHLMETGIISETKVKKTRHVKLVSWVIATTNSVEKIIEPLLSRFVVLEIPEYTFEEFTEISITRLASENVKECTAQVIAGKVWNELGSRDVRDVVKVARLASSIEDISLVVRMLNRKYMFDGTNKN